MSQKTALITGITGQDGAYLAEFLIEKGYNVHGLKQVSATPNTQNIEHLMGSITLHNGDMNDANAITALIADIRPDEIYNLAGQSQVGTSFDLPEYTAQVNALGALRILESIRILNLQNTTRFYQASTSEIFGNAPHVPQTEETPLNPCSPYACAKVYAHHITQTYREAYGVHVSCGILFNHESPIRGEEFVTRKITQGVAALKMGGKTPITLGNIDAQRDWGHAADYVRGMWMMIQQDKPDDYILATGETHSVRDFIDLAFKCVGIQLRWEGQGKFEKAFDVKTRQTLVEIDRKLYRPTDIAALRGDASKARKVLGWTPQWTFETLVQDMLRSDLNALESHENNTGDIVRRDGNTAWSDAA